MWDFLHLVMYPRDVTPVGFFSETRCQWSPLPTHLELPSTGVWSIVKDCSWNQARNVKILTTFAVEHDEGCVCSAVFKIEALIWVSFWRAVKFQPFNRRVGWNLRRRSKNIEMKYKTHMKCCAWIIWYMFLLQCEELRINHVTLFLVATVPYTCWFLWRQIILRTSSDVFVFNLGLRFERLFWEGYILKGKIAFEGHWRLQSWTLVLGMVGRARSHVKAGTWAW